MAKIKEPVTLQHQANVGDAVVEYSFTQGEEVTVLKTWDDRVLCKSQDGKLFNIPNDYIEV